MTTRPENYETERMLLGTLMTFPTDTVIRSCWAAGLEPADFSRPQHRVVYEAIVHRIKRGEESDAMSVANQLRREEIPTERGKTVNALEFIGGQVEVLKLQDEAGVPALAKSNAEEIVSQALSREMVLVGEDLQEQGKALAPIADVVTAAERRMAVARDRAEGRHGVARKSDAAELLQRVLEHYISPEPDDLIPFPLPTLNEIGGGMAPGDIVVIGARSGVGKTWHGLDVSEQVLRAGRRVVNFSMEMPAEQIMRRLIAMGGHSLTGIKKRSVPYDELIDRAGIIDSWRNQYDIFDGPTSVDRMQGVLASARIDGKPYRLVVVDHLHLLDVPGSRSDYRIALNQELTRIKHLAVEHGATVVLLGQLNRPKKGDEAKRPTIHDLRESGGIGDIADYVLLLHREPGEDGYPTNRGVVIVEKVRDGAGACDIDVTFDPRTYRFGEGYMAGITRARSIA